MRGYMFRNRWGALLFVGLVLASVTRLVGTGNGDGALDAAREQIVEQGPPVEALVAESVPPGEPLPTEFTPDEELIDPGTGEDPTPIDPQPDVEPQPAAEGDVPHGSVVLLSPGAEELPPAPPFD